MNTTMKISTPQAPMQPRSGEPHYLADHSIRSWLLTTDHKRIGILYMLSITLFFFVGGSAAVARAATGADAAAVEGAVDAGVWVAAAAASLASTLLLAAVGTVGLSGVGAVLLLPAVVLLARGHQPGGGPDRCRGVVDAGWAP